MNERTLRTLIDAAAVKRARIIAQGARFRIEIEAPGRSFTLENAKGELRLWSSLGAAAKWLKGMGIAESLLDLRHWTPDQKELAF